jgi:hypothetical protein
VIFFFWLKYDNSVILGYGEHRIQGTRRLVYMYTLSVRPGPAAPPGVDRFALREEGILRFGLSGRSCEILRDIRHLDDLGFVHVP